MEQTYTSMETNRERRKNLHIYGQLTDDEGSKNIQWGKGQLFNKWCWENWTATYKRFKLNPYFISYTKINSNWIKDLDTDLKL